MITVRTEGTWTQVPSDIRIFGNFIESGFGRQVAGMWSEMVYNRAFREVPPYKRATWTWLGIDPEYYNENAPFWHSGYEEYDWEPFGDPEMRHLVGNRTYKGMTALRAYNGDGRECGLRQRGIHLQVGMRYRFTILIGVEGAMRDAGLEGFGITEHTNAEYPVTVTIGGYEHHLSVSTITRKYEWSFTAIVSEVAELSIRFAWKGALVLSCVSLMPADNLDGWRRNAVERLRQIAPPVVRFPGGCFVSFYNWQSSVGDRDAREPMPSFYWGGLEENDAGLDEFMRLSELVGFEAQICFNMMTSNPFQARQLVEYLNAPEDVGMGRLRMLNGRAEPYRVKLFEMDNEPGRKWTALQYAEQCASFAREMRLADPEIEFMMASYEYPIEVLPRMLEIAGPHIDYVVYRQGWPSFVNRVLPIVRAYNEKAGTKIRVANTEWLPSCASIEPFEDPAIPTDFRWKGEITNDYRKIFSTQQASWNYALNGATTLLHYMGYGGEFALANFNNMCNTWGQNVIEATKEECYLSCMGEVFRFFRRNFVPCYAVQTTAHDDADEAPKGSGDGADVLETVSALLTRGTDGGEKLYLVNHSSRMLPVQLPEGAWQCDDAIRADGRMVRAAADHDVVKSCDVPIRGGSVAELPGLSLCCLGRIDRVSHSE